MVWPFKDRWGSAVPFDQFVRESTEHCALWTGVYRTAQVPAWAVDEAAAMGVNFRLVVLAEDWCGDASNTVPVIAKWAERVPGLELRVLRRDQHPDVMDRYLTGTARSIPVVIVLTEDFEEIGRWGPRPRELQEFVKEQRALGREKKEYYPDVRRWYAKDKGHTTLRELLTVMGRAAHTAGVAVPG